MIANKQAMPYLPDGVDINALSCDQLAVWANTIQQKTGKRLLGFPVGPQGLMHRFFEGFFYPSYTGGVVVPFRSEAAEAMWTYFASLWKSVNPNSTSYNFMQELLLSGDVWIGFDPTSPACSMRCARNPTNSSRFRLRPAQGGGATCRCWPASRW